jgi:hypothetical protein
MNIRSALATCAVAGLVLFCPAARPEAQAQVAAPVTFDQTLLDRWLDVFPAVMRMTKPDAVPMSDDAGQEFMEHICAGAGFASYDQCAEVFFYAGMIMGACDRKSRSFRDPIKLMRRQIAKIEANAGLSPEQKAKATAGLKEVVARFPDNIPAAHLRLMTANRDRIFEIVMHASADLSAQPDGWENW